MLNLLIVASLAYRPCLMPPSGASPQCVVCYTDACIDYQNGQNDCMSLPPGPDRQLCLDLSELLYTTDLIGCSCAVARVFVLSPMNTELVCNF